MPSSRGTAGPDVWVNYIPAHARGELAKPQYPAAAFAARAGTHSVTVMLTIDGTGRISDIQPSRIDLPNRFSEAFLESVRIAVASWVFEPARAVHWKRSPDGQDEYVRTEVIAERIEIKFTFEASGPVR